LNVPLVLQLEDKSDKKQGRKYPEEKLLRLDLAETGGFKTGHRERSEGPGNPTGLEVEEQGRVIGGIPQTWGLE
jgi:hypothetical protein